MKEIQLPEDVRVLVESSMLLWYINIVHPALSKLSEIADAIGCDITDLLVSKKNKK